MTTKQLFDIEKFNRMPEKQRGEITKELERLSKLYLARMSPVDITTMYQVAADQGGYYVVNCSPDRIPDNCPRKDCLMRSAVRQSSPEENPDLLALKCEPTGYLADFINYSRSIQDTKG